MDCAYRFRRVIVIGYLLVMLRRTIAVVLGQAVNVVEYADQILATLEHWHKLIDANLYSPYSTSFLVT
jgi:hypothetical protein